MYKKILMAFDGTAEGRSALVECADIASFAHAETHLLAVASMPSTMFLTEGFVPEELIETEKKRMQGVLDQGIAVLRERGFESIPHLAVGEPVEEIGRAAKDLKCDLIVVGHKQESRWAARWWKGSVSASLVDYVPCSLLIVITK
jgi:nucleotide-binding universal stress UspA family protein